MAKAVIDNKDPNITRSYSIPLSIYVHLTKLKAEKKIKDYSLYITELIKKDMKNIE